MGEQITVACKLPNGLACSVYDPAHLVGLAQRDPKDPANIVPKATFYIRGSRQVLGENFMPADPAHKVSPEGYGLSRVDGDTFTEWLRQSADYPPVKNGFIFAYNEGLANELKGLTTGFEGASRDPKALKAAGLELATAEG